MLLLKRFIIKSYFLIEASILFGLIILFFYHVRGRNEEMHQAFFLALCIMTPIFTIIFSKKRYKYHFPKTEEEKEREYEELRKFGETASKAKRYAKINRIYFWFMSASGWTQVEIFAMMLSLLMSCILSSFLHYVSGFIFFGIMFIPVLLLFSTYLFKKEKLEASKKVYMIDPDHPYASEYKDILDKTK